MTLPSCVMTTETALSPEGSVTFSQGPTVLGTVALDPAGRATLTAALGPGRPVVTAVYNGDGVAALSAAAIAVDAPAATTTELTVH